MFAINNIPLSDIAVDYKYNFSNGNIISKDFITLKNDIIKNGLFVPIVVSDDNDNNNDNSFSLVSGFKRFEVFKQLNKETIPVLVKKFESEFERIKFFYEDNLRYKVLYHSEIMDGVYNLSNLFNCDFKLISDILKISTGQCKLYLAMKDLSLELVNFINDEKLFLKLVLKYLELINLNLYDFILFLAKYQVNCNTQKIMINYLLDIMMRDDLDAETVLNIINFYNIFSNPKYNIHNAKDIILNRLFSLRFPCINTVKTAFNNITKKYVSNSKIKIEPPDNFEGDYILLSVKMRKNEELPYIIDTLNNMHQNKAVQSIINTFVSEK